MTGSIMHFLIIGKILETIGAALVFWVGAQACYLEVMIEGPVRDSSEKDDAPNQAGKERKDDLDRVQKQLERINERRRRQFGYWESISVAAGTALILAGCVVYLIGLLSEHN